MKIDYKNRTVLLSGGYEANGQKEIQLYYDRFDRIVYYVNGNGEFYYSDGQPYTPTPIPNDNEILWTAAANGVLSLKLLNPIITSSATTNSITVENGVNTGVVSILENDTLILMSFENSDTMFLTATLENKAGDITTMSSIVAWTGQYQIFESEEAMCSYWTENPEVLTNPAGTFYYDNTTGKSYIDQKGTPLDSSFLGKWIIVNLIAIPDDFEGGTEGPFWYGTTFEETEDGIQITGWIDSITDYCYVAPPAEYSPVDARIVDDVPYVDYSAACSDFTNVGGSPTSVEPTGNTTLYREVGTLNWFFDDAGTSPLTTGVYLVYYWVPGQEIWYMITIVDGVSTGSQELSEC